jgi:Mg2+ and Co2+ transporter CorA
MKKSAGYKYSSKYLLEAMVAVKQQHPQFDWIPKPQNTDSIDAVATERTQGQTASSDDANHDTLDESLIPRMLSRIEQRAEKQSAQLRMTFQALTTAITIEDSDFNKKQAQRSTMLTLLAAIYLPLTLATGIFGMNIQEINGGTPRWWIVVVVTAILFVPSLSFIYILFVGEGVKKKF